MPRCAAPFTQLLLQPSGKVTPCCYLYGHSAGDLTKQSIKDVWNGGKLRKLRREFLSDTPRTCTGRMRNIACHKEFTHLEPYVVWDEFQASSPMRLDLRLNGQCNLSCKMCDVWQQPNGTYRDSELWEKGPEEIFPYLKEVDLLGGEPLIQRDTYRLIEQVRHVNPNCTFGIVTNGHFPISQKIVDLIGSTPLRYIQISLDAICPLSYARQRGGSLALPMTFLERSISIKHTNPFEIRVSLCVTNENWWDIPGFLRLCTALDVKPVLQFAYYSPNRHMLLETNHTNEKQRIVTYLKEHTPSNAQHYLHQIIEPLAKHPD